MITITGHICLNENRNKTLVLPLFTTQSIVLLLSLLLNSILMPKCIYCTQLYPLCLRCLRSTSVQNLLFVKFPMGLIAFVQYWKDNDTQHESSNNQLFYQFKHIFLTLYLYVKKRNVMVIGFTINLVGLIAFLTFLTIT